MRGNSQIVMVVAIITVALGASVSLFGDISAPVKLTMFGLGTIAGILIGRFVTLRRISTQAQS
ncbi:MAG: hypothetical protein AAFV93_18215 [Chloroflexota bacterium]